MSHGIQAVNIIKSNKRVFQLNSVKPSQRFFLNIYRTFNSFALNAMIADVNSSSSKYTYSAYRHGPEFKNEKFWDVWNKFGWKTFLIFTVFVSILIVLCCYIRKRMQKESE